MACSLVGIDWPMFLKMTVLSGSLKQLSEINSLMGTNGFVHALVICCGSVTTLFRFGLHGLQLLLLRSSSLLLVVLYLLPSVTLLVVACVVDDVLERAVFPLPVR